MTGEGQAMVGDREVTLPYSNNEVGYHIRKLSTRFLQLSTVKQYVEVTWDVDQRIYVTAHPAYRDRVSCSTTM